MAHSRRVGGRRARVHVRTTNGGGGGGFCFCFVGVVVNLDTIIIGGVGFVTIVGRLKELIVRGGNKITPLEVERALCTCPGVAAAMAVGMPDPVLGQRIHALLVPKAGQTLVADAIRAGLANSLEKFKHPDACYVGTEMPTGRTGKLDRGQLQAMLQSGAMSPLAGWTHPRTQAT